MSVVIKQFAYGLSIGTDIGDLERPNSPYFALYYRICWLWGR